MATQNAFILAREKAAMAIQAELSTSATALASAFTQADEASDKAGFSANRQSRSGIKALNLDAFAVWTPQKADVPSDNLNAMEIAIRDLNRRVAFEHSLDGQEAIKSALKLAVAASSDENAKLARQGEVIGDDGQPLLDDAGKAAIREGKPGFKAVYAKVLDRNAEGMANAIFKGTEADAKDELDKRANQRAGDNEFNPTTAPMFQAGLEAIDNPIKLRALGARLNLLQKRRSRFVATLYLNVAGDKLDAFAKNNGQNLKPIGEVWLTACEAAMAAHTAFMKEQSGSTEPKPQELQAAMDTAVDAYLSQYVGGGVAERTDKTPEQQLEETREKLWKLAEKHDRLSKSDTVTKALALISLPDPRKSKAKTNSEAVTAPVAPTVASGTVTAPTGGVSPAAAAAIAPTDNSTSVAPAAPSPATGAINQRLGALQNKKPKAK